MVTKLKLRVGVGCSAWLLLQSCLISPKDYPLDTSELASSGGTDSVAGGGKAGDKANGGKSSGGGNLGGSSTSAGTTSSGAGDANVGGEANFGGEANTGGEPNSGGKAGSGGSTSGGNAGAGAGGTAGGGGNAGAGGTAGGGGAAGTGGSSTTNKVCSDHPLTLKSTWVATASSSSLGSGSENDDLYDPPSHMTDGLLAERWASGKPQSGDEWVQVDFGATVAVSTITLSVGAFTSDYPRAYALRVSNSAQDFAAPVLASGNGSVGNTVIQLSQPATGRYLTIKQTGFANLWWSIAELLVSCN